MKSKKQITNLVVGGIFIGLTIILTLIPNVGFIIIPGLPSYTIVHIPILIGIMILPFSYSIVLGLTFGICSLISSFIYAQSIFDLAFQNPLISVLPRLLFAVIAFFIFFLMKLLVKKSKYGKEISFGLVTLLTLLTVILAFYSFASSNENIPNELFIIIGIIIGSVAITFFYIAFKKSDDNAHAAAASFIASTLIHTLLVLTAVSIFSVEALSGMGEIKDVISAVLVSNGMVEAFMAGIIGTPVVVAVYKRFPELFGDNYFKVNEEETKDDTTL